MGVSVGMFHSRTPVAHCTTAGLPALPRPSHPIAVCPYPSAAPGCPSSPLQAHIFMIFGACGLLVQTVLLRGLLR
jgi:hypothetical protein